MVSAFHDPILIFPIAVTCVRLFFTLITVPTLLIPVPASKTDSIFPNEISSTYFLLTASVWLIG